MDKKLKIKNFFINIGKRIKNNFGWRSALFLGVFAAMLVVDLVTKHFAEADDWHFTVIPGFIEVDGLYHNDGASLGMGGGTTWAQPLFITFTFIALPVFIGAILLLPERFTLLKLCLYMATSGAIGNLVDRLAFGYVRDFIGMDWGFVSYVCNFADIWLMVGLVLAVIDMLFLNEVAVFPLTKRAKQAQQKRKEEEEAKKAEGHSEQSVPEASAEDTVPGHGNEAEQSGGAEKKDE